MDNETVINYRLTFTVRSQTILAAVRLQSLLKVALRRFGFRCVNIEVVGDEALPRGGVNKEANR